MCVNDQCRICLNQRSSIGIFDVENDNSNVSAKIMSVAHINISPNDGLPQNICSRCLKKLNECIEFIQLCKSSDIKLRAAISTIKLEPESFNFNSDTSFYEFKYTPKSDKEKDLLIDNITEPCNSYEKINNNVKEDSKNITNKDNSKVKKAIKQQCSMCGKVMSSIFRLKTHLRTHTGERPYSCQHCKKNFTLEQNLKVHLRTHTGEKPLRCSECGESFAQSSGLAAHRRKHTGHTPYNCKLCPKSFRTYGHLQYHTRCHTGEKNFDCETCGRAFITSSHLKHHLMTHSGDRPHVCCECGGRFTRASHLKRHIHRMHAGSQKRDTEKMLKIQNIKKTKKTKEVNGLVIASSADKPAVD